ncbi:response regulator transcription factor [Amycolatopsis silviterrae]|uniref:Response regulator n=1 Tax=Amycolatopsis silviterrae TaxID=1656914 RepID=A0ABW5HK57_9PSEU
MIRVFVVDDHAVVRRGLRAFLDAQPDMDCVGEAPDPKQALAQLAEADVLGPMPDVVLMDLVMPAMDGISGIQAIKERHPAVEVVAVTSFSESERVAAALAAGASGYLLKDAEPDEVAAAVRAAAAGAMHLDPAVAPALRALTGTQVLPQLSPREREVLRLVAQGMTNQAIAAELSISERTARTHVSNILLKIGVSTRTQAALWAIREGVAPPP